MPIAYITLTVQKASPTVRKTQLQFVPQWPPFLGLYLLEKSGFEYSATEVFEYSNTYKYVTSCFRPIKNKTLPRGVTDLTIN